MDTSINFLRRENVYKHSIFQFVQHSADKSKHIHRHRDLIYFTATKIYVYIDENYSIVVCDIIDLVDQENCSKIIDEITFDWNGKVPTIHSILVNSSNSYVVFVNEEEIVVGELNINKSKTNRIFQIPIASNTSVIDFDWHPNYQNILILLTNDNCLHAFDVSNHIFVKDYFLPSEDSKEKNEKLKSPKSSNISQLLGNSAIKFAISNTDQNNEKFYILYGNADIYIVNFEISLTENCKDDSINGPLCFNPSLSDEIFDSDAVTIQFLSNDPDILAIILENGYIIHALILDFELIPIETIDISDMKFDRNIHKMSLSVSRESYVVRHKEGIYKISLDWMSNLRDLISKSDVSFESAFKESSSIKSLIYTKVIDNYQYLYSFAYTNNPVFGIHLFCLDSNFKLFILPLTEKTKITLAFADSKNVTESSYENDKFVKHIKTILKRKENVPLFVTEKQLINPEQKFEFGDKALKIFQNEYYKKQKLAAIEIQDKICNLQKQFNNFDKILDKLSEEKILMDKDFELIEDKIESLQYGQTNLTQRLLNLAMKLQCVVNIPSKFEIKIYNDLKNLQQRLNQYKSKMSAAQRRLSKISLNSSQSQVERENKFSEYSKKSIGLSPLQHKQIRNILKENNDDIDSLVKCLKTINID